MSMHGAPDAQQPPSAFVALMGAIESRRLTGDQAAALLRVFGELQIWDELESRASIDRPEHAGDPLARNAYLAGLAERPLAVYRDQLARLDEASPSR